MDSQKGAGFSFLGLIVCLLLGYIAYDKAPVTVPLKNDNLMLNAPALFGYLLLLSLVVERAIEVFLSTLRGSDAQAKDDEINELLEEIAYLEASDCDQPDLEPKRKRLTLLNQQRRDYRIKSRKLAQWFGLSIGFLVALVGMRILGNIINLDVAGITTEQKQFFVLVDVLLTGAVLAGGSEAINKITKRFDGFMTNPNRPPQNTAG